MSSTPMGEALGNIKLAEAVGAMHGVAEADPHHAGADRAIRIAMSDLARKRTCTMEQFIMLLVAAGVPVGHARRLCEAQDLPNGRAWSQAEHR